MQLNLKLSVKDSIKSNPNPNPKAKPTPTPRPNPTLNVVDNQLSKRKFVNNISICSSSIGGHPNKPIIWFNQYFS